MMQHAIDRGAQTGGSFVASTVVHVVALLILTFLVGRSAVERMAGDELTEIAYIEARYGEDVAEKVKLKALKPPGAPGRGITTESAVKSRPEPVVAEVSAPEIAAPEIAPQPRLEPRKPMPAAPKLEPKAQAERPQLAAATVPDMAPAAVPQRELAQAAQLEARTAPAPQKRVLDTDKLQESLTGQVTDVAATTPRPARPAKRADFVPQNSGLKSRGGRAPVGADPVVAASSSAGRTSGSVAGADVALAGGGLSQRSAPARPQGPQRPSLARGSAGGGMIAGVVDVKAPSSGSGNGAQSGRKTILDYGEGSGGGGGGALVGRRGRLAEPSAKRDIVAAAEPVEPKQRVAEAKLDGGKGVGMTITGQIAGRKVLSRVAPAYSAKARKHGWEGVVAVHFTVLPDGRVKDNVFFEQTSVHRDLNQAAMAAIRQFRFAALPTSQSSVEQWGVITIVFRLN